MEKFFKRIRIYLNKLLTWICKAAKYVLYLLKHYRLIVYLLLFLLLFITIPLLNGAKFGNILQWYGNVLFSEKNAQTNIKTTLSQKVNEYKNKADDISNEEQEAEEPHFTTWKVNEFKKVKYKPSKVIKKQKETKRVEEKVQDNSEKEISSTKQKHKIFEKQIKENKFKQGPLKEELPQYYVKIENPNLAYLNTPESLVGTAEIFGPNSLYIKDRIVLLYGINTSSDTHDVKKVQQYLNNLASGKEVHCEILAYKVQTQAATALCFVNGIFINKSLVDHNLADNEALK